MSIFGDHGWRITSPYGWRIHPIYGDRRWHAGIDLVKYHQAPVEAFLGGRVLFAGQTVSGSGLGGYGYAVLIEDGHGYLHLYAHLDSVDVVAEAQVDARQVVGRQGATGNVTGSHLHYEVRVDGPYYGWGGDVNPGSYLEKLLDTDDWKREGLEYLADRGFIDADYWEGRLDEPLPVWAGLLVIKRIAERSE